MHWYGTFRAAFFGGWAAAGLPDPARHIAGYRAAVAAARCPLDLPAAEPGPLAGDLVDRVYGFGSVLGAALGGLLGVPGAATAPAADWCGRFNLGISLVDYVCDESGRAQALASLPPFAAWSGSPAVPPGGGFREEEMVASRVAADLVAELRAVAGGWTGWEQCLAGLFRGEVFVAGERLGGGSDLDAVREALRATSAGPFAVLAARMALGAPAVDVAAAQRLGSAVGALFWLVDDARDLWIDLARRSWNLFLVEVARRDPALLAAPPSPLRDAAISRLLHGALVAERESAAALRDLLATLQTVGAGPEAAADHLGTVAAALALW